MAKSAKKRRISATVAARSFSGLMNRVRHRGESFLVEQGGKPICEILPAGPAKFSGADLASLLRSLPKPDSQYLSIVEELIRKQCVVRESGGGAGRLERSVRGRRVAGWWESGKKVQPTGAWRR